MSDDDLRHLDPDAVVTLVRRLEARIAELEAELAQRRGPPKTPANSSVPPSKGDKGAPPAERPRGKHGPPHGHPGTSRRRGVPDQIVECQPEQCAGCGRSLAHVPLHCVGTSQVVELPPVQPRIIEARRYAATCAHCGVTTTAPYPPGLEPTRVFGPHLEAIVAYLHEEHHVGYARVQAVAHDLFGLALSPGAIANSLARTATRLAPAVAAIREQVRASPVIGSDETSARVRGQTWWQWVFQSPTASYHVIVPRRNGAVVETFLGDVPVLAWVSDLWKPQLGARAVYHQVCLAHQLRDLQYVIDAEQSAWAAAFQALLSAAIHLAHERDAGRCTGARYAAGVAMVEAWCTALLATPVAGADAARLWVRYRAHRDHLFVFLTHPEVPPTNNASERALRNSVIHRKVTGGFRSEWGADAHAAVMTVLQTARKQGQAVLATLQGAVGAPFPTRPAPSLSFGR